MTEREQAKLSPADWLALPLWDGLDYGMEHGERFRAEWRGTPYLVTIVRHEGQTPYSTSQRVEFVY